MADVANIDDDGAAEAEPAECSRLVYTCLLGGVAAALFYAFALVLTLDLPTRSTALYVAQVAALVLTMYPGCWFLFFFTLLLYEWYLGNPRGCRTVDIFLRSDRPFLLESIHQSLL